LVFEGEKTEVQYFNGIIDNRKEIGINSSIKIKHLLRSYNEKGWSNPKKILNRLIQYFEECKLGTLTVDSFVDRVIDYLIEDEVISDRSVDTPVYTPGRMKILLIEYFQKEMDLSPEDVIKDETLATNSVCLCLENSVNLLNVTEKINKYINEQKTIYAEGFDRICLIADRDRKSFKTDQYDYVLNTCNSKGYSFFLSNPRIELWLLMHFDEIMNCENEKLLEDPYETKDKRFITNKLESLQVYKDKSVRFDAFKGRINKAIQNEKHFCEDIVRLKTVLGSNIGLLLEEMMQE
jgi:hypothetical protein